jgi:hypothetical protein
MRLFEIIQHKSTISEPPIDDEMRADPVKHGILDKHNGASFSFVTPGDDPHEVRKYHKTSRGGVRDGFVLYAEYIVRHKLWDNVHFPRIYVTNVAASHIDEFYDWTMERLTPWHEITEEEYLAMAGRYFSGPGVTEIVNSTSDEEFVDNMCRALLTALWGSHRITVIDDELDSAIVRLRQIKGAVGFDDYDLHMENIMFRRTPVGTQLVFSDPFGFLP